MKTSLYLQDCISGMTQQVSPSSVDVIVTSPPYNIGIQYSTYQDSLAKDDYLQWTLKWTEAAKQTLKDDGSLFLNLGARPSDPLWPYEIICEISKHGFVLQNTIVWIKSVAIKDVQQGHYKPINSKRFLHDCHEYIFHLTKSGNVTLDRLSVGVPYVYKSNVARWKHTEGKDKHCRGNTWFMPYKTISSRDKDRPHPATFPPELPVNCIKLHGKSDPVVMDPFLGLGNSGIGAKQCNAKEFIGFEIDKGYFEIAKQNIS